MFTSVKKIGILVIFILVLPVVVFSVFEIGSLRQHEKVIWDIYKNQLDAILFTVNQYSEEVVSGLASKIEYQTNTPGGNVKDILKEVTAVNSLVQFGENNEVIRSYPEVEDSGQIKKLENVLVRYDTVVSRLKNYLSGDYRKLFPVPSDQFKGQIILFVTRENEKNISNLLILNSEKFISEVLDPKIQETTRDKFYVTAYQKGSGDYIYNSDKSHEPGRIIENKPFWLLDGYSMGIELKDATIADLTRERVKRNFILIGIMDLILLSGAVIIFLNIRKQFQLSQMKSDFVSNVSHEIRTPLALISMYIETLEMGRVKSQEKIKEYYSIILNETQRLSAMVNRILSFSQIEGNKRKYSFGSIDVNDVIGTTVHTFSYNLENKGFKVNVGLGEDLPDITADREAVAEALVNLIDNAVKYSSENKEIRIGSGRRDGFVFIEVEDKGIGISGKDQRYIFDQFYRVTEKNLANRVKGSGLGLAIVRHIMSAHRGTVEVESTPGKGSLFRLLFPLNNSKTV